MVGATRRGVWVLTAVLALLLMAGAATGGSQSSTGSMDTMDGQSPYEAPQSADDPGDPDPDGRGQPTRSDRKAVLDTLRGPVQSDLASQVEFVVEMFRIEGAWAFVLATPQQPGGREIEWERTPCAGDVSHLVGGLLQRTGDGWSVVTYALCPTDVAWADWPSAYGAPATLFEP